MKSTPSLVRWIAALAVGLSACTTEVRMDPAQKLAIAGIRQLPLSAGLVLTKELQQSVSVLQTSPFDSLSYPSGQQTAGLFRHNLPQVFRQVVEIEARNAPAAVDLIVEPSVLRFDAVVPMPAYNPYSAKIVYRVEVYDKAGAKILTQTVTGEAQGGKGLMSGFQAQAIVAEVAQKAMEDAMRQILEGLSSAPELAPERRQGR